MNKAKKLKSEDYCLEVGHNIIGEKQKIKLRKLKHNELNDIYHCDFCGNFFYKSCLQEIFDYCVKYEFLMEKELCHALPCSWDGEYHSSVCGKVSSINNLNSIQLIKLKKYNWFNLWDYSAGFTNYYEIDQIKVKGVLLWVAGRKINPLRSYGQS